jgi:reductive dehalogenase
LIIVLSPRPKKELRFKGKQEKIDERDVVFARFDLEKGEKNYIDYYKWKPSFKEIDEEIRKLPDILSPSQLRKNPIHFPLAAAEFDFLEKQLEFVDGQVSLQPVEKTAEENSQMLREILSYLGSDLSGICELDQSFVYSHVGRGPEPYGKKIFQRHKYAVVFAVEMDWNMISAAPRSPVIIETGKKYVEAARISIVAASFIRRMGYPARAHIAGSNYQAVLPPLGWKAGLGEVGRMGILMTWKFGPRVRLGLVTTDLPLKTDPPRHRGMEDFCSKCEKCASNCPAKAIPHGDPVEENGILKWALNRELCYRYWRKAGTDCAVCVFVCPYSKPANPVHNLVRLVVAQSRAAQSLSIWGDDFFYGRFPPRRKFSPF